TRNATFLRDVMWRDGRLLHSWRGGTAKIPGMLDDYAYVALGLIELYRATGDLAHLTWARDLFDVILANFRDDETGLFFDTSADGEELLVRQKSLFDSPTPSGNAAVAQLAHWLGRYFERKDWEAIADGVLARVAGSLVEAPT